MLENNTFNGMPAMKVLHLHSNQITRFQGDEFQGNLVYYLVNHSLWQSVSLSWRAFTKGTNGKVRLSLLY